MKKLIGVILAALFTMSILGTGPTPTEAKLQDKPEFKNVELTESQIKELKTMYEDVINKRKGIINKYVEFGVLEEKDAEKMIAHLDRISKKIEKDGYIPKWDKKGKHNHKKEELHKK